MLGERLDYWFLRPFTHARNYATEAQLDAQSRAATPVDYDGAVAKLRKLASRFDGRFPIDPDLTYLDLGCGSGALSLALIRLGAGHVTGVDLVRRRIEEANLNAARLRLEASARFICADLHSWEPPQKYDVLISHNAFEHIAEPQAFLASMARFVAPGGIAVISFGPLFHSPFGDHAWDFFRVQIPWRGVLFSEQAIMRLRRECFRPTDGATRMCDITGGLNRMRLSAFRRHAASTGWQFDYLSVNHTLARVPGLKSVSDIVVKTRLGDYFAHSVDAVMRR